MVLVLLLPPQKRTARVPRRKRHVAILACIVGTVGTPFVFCFGLASPEERNNDDASSAAALSLEWFWYVMVDRREVNELIKV